VPLTNARRRPRYPFCSFIHGASSSRVAVIDRVASRAAMTVTVLLLAAQLAATAAGAPPPAPAPPELAPAQTAVPPLTLAAAVTQARTASPRRRAAASAADGARDALRLAGRLPNPIVDLRTENWSPSRRAASPQVDVFAVVSQPLELGGQRAIRRQLAAAESGAASTALVSLERELALDTVRAYVHALKARALVETLSANREGLAMLVASVDRRVSEGYSPEADLLKFKTEAARVDGDVARARLEMERSLSALSVVMGAERAIQPSQLVEPPPLPAPAATADAIAASLARHPDVLTAAAGVERARQLTAYERARRLPEPLITGGYKRTAGFDTLVVGVSLAVPLFDRNGVAVAQAVAREQGLAADRDVLVYQLTSDAAALIRAAQTMSERAVRAPDELLAPAEDVRRAARAAFREGAADVLKLIDAERVYTEVHRAAIELRLDALLTAIEARFAIGEEAIP
jgi:cobalt-zinc-cadmium efflux system outer membrane protein